MRRKRGYKLLTSKQRARLKSIAASTETILQIGKGGVGEQLVKQVDDALTARELVKLRALETAPEEPGELAQALAEAGEDFRLLILSDHKTLTATRGHGADPVPFLLYDSRRDTGRGGVYDEPAGNAGPFVKEGCVLLDLLFEKKEL